MAESLCMYHICLYFLTFPTELIVLTMMNLFSSKVLPFFFLAKYIQTNVKINLWCISCFVLFFVSFFLLENPPLLINLAKKLLLIQGKQVSDFNQEFVSTKQQVADKNKLELQGIDSEP